jgi:hypothetical protein
MAIVAIKLAVSKTVLRVTGMVLCLITSPSIALEGGVAGLVAYDSQPEGPKRAGDKAPDYQRQDDKQGKSGGRK